jgi:hypothetical protein
MSVLTTIPSNVTVGDQNLPSTLRIRNTSVSGFGETGFELDSYRIDPANASTPITLVPSCGSQNGTPDCPAGFEDVGVLVPDATGTGSGACLNITFTFTLIDIVQGKYAVVPSSAFDLGPSEPPGAAPSPLCIISFTTDVLKAPTRDANSAIAGLQTDQKSFARAIDVGPTVVNVGQSATGAGTTETRIVLAQPAISTVATNAELGGAIGDTATITGLTRPVTSGAGAGTVTFQLYSGPQSAGCTAENLVFTSDARPITFTGGSPATGGTATATYTPAAAGTYHWVESFSGDVNNLPVTGACDAANESSTVTPPPTATTTPPPPGTPPYPCVPPPAAGQPTPPLLPGQEICSVAQVLPAASTPAGTAKATAPTGCVTTNFNVQVSGRQIRRVVFYLDSKKVSTLARPNRGTRFALAVRPNSLRRGTHRVLAVTYFTTASKTPKRTLRVAFSRCARQAAAPRFTG